MTLFYVRHGDPTYTPDALTPLGRRQAESVAKRLTLFGLDKIYASTSTRAMETALPTCELLKMRPQVVQNFHESWMYNDDASLSEKDGNIHWSFTHPEIKQLLLSKEVRDLGDKWYTHPEIAKFKDFKPVLDRVATAVDGFLANLGYHYDSEKGMYRVTAENTEQRVALFAHEGFGKYFLSRVLDIPYPQIARKTDMTHTGVTVIRFSAPDEDGYCHARLMTLSNDSHLYRDGLPLRYQNAWRF